MNPALRRLIDRVLVDVDRGTPQQRLALWSDIADLTPQESELGQLARANRLVAEEQIRVQHDFLALLHQEHDGR